ncbi:MAG: hypothetical protein HY260_04295 [Chloroflexi bacterium]|nr:hypothetical protein [Chloroflexota bacterium]
MKRSEVLTIIEAALTVGDTGYAREAAMQLLAAWPGDLSGQMALARAHMAESEPMPAIDLLEAIVAVDPENSAAQRLLGSLFKSAGRRDHAAAAFASARVVDGHGMPFGVNAPQWAEPAFWARLALERGEWESAKTLAERALESHPDVPLPSLLYLIAVRRGPGRDVSPERLNGSAAHEYRPLAEGFHARWPGCVAFSLCLAECLLGDSPEVRDPGRAIALLHEAGTLDPAGEVVARYWGESHAYRSLWPFPPNPDLPGPLPSNVSGALGLNRLLPAKEDTGRKPPDASAGARHSSPATPPPSAESLTDIQAELDRLAARIRSPKASNPQPLIPNPSTHLLLTSKTRLIQKYGADAVAEIVVQLSELADASAQSSGCASVVLYVDDRDSLRPYGLRPANPENAWEIKLLLRDLSAALKSKGETINSVLIVGGDDVIPFHRLPNPIDDADGEVPSDNPYAAPDENFFIPEWAIGRLPAPAGNEASALLRLIGATIAAHQKESIARNPARAVRRQPLVARLFARLRQWLLPLVPRQAPVGKESFGYAARAWHQASAAVFAAIGDVRHLNTCPPLDVSTLPAQGLAPSSLSYFNLHGVEDGPEWYGQREAGDLRSPQYPIALRPRDVVNSGRAPGLVFTEACYGANIEGKAIDDALCLKFLDSGSRGVVGSTKIAYGSVASPLIGADLLGKLFWDALKEGWPMGEALRRAKLALAREMHKRQGFLDGEDQKTLVSFVLYGDPLLRAASPFSAIGRQSSTVSGNGKAASEIAGGDLTLCADEATAADLGLSRPETVAHIKSLVARYLPGMEEADMRVAQQHRFAASAALHGSGDELSRHYAQAKTIGAQTGNVVFTLSKTIHAEAREFWQYVRVTVDKRGKIVKMAVSR